MNRHFAGKGCSSVQRRHYIAECRQTGAPTVPGKLEQNMAALDRDVVGHWRRHAATVGAARPSKRRRLTQRATGWRPKAARRRRGSASALRCAARVPAIPRRVSRRAAAAEGDTRAHGGAVEETWKTATGGSLACVRDAGRGGDGERGAQTAPGVDGKWNTVHPGRYLIYRPGSRPPQPSDLIPTPVISQDQSQSELLCLLVDLPVRSAAPHRPPDARDRRRPGDIVFLRVSPEGNAQRSRWARLFASRGFRHPQHERLQAAPNAGAPRRSHAPTPAASPCSSPRACGGFCPGHCMRRRVHPPARGEPSGEARKGRTAWSKR